VRSGPPFTTTLDGMKSAVALLTVGGIAITSIVAAADPPWYRRNIPNTKDSCRAAGGEWSKTPLFQSPYCRVKYSDSGKQCGRSGECQSQICVIENPAQRFGKCHGEAERFATFWYLDENGKAEKISVE
jgi:hypothetical protein